MNESLEFSFPIQTAADWKADILASLKGESIASIAKTDRSGIILHPFYTDSDVAQPTENFSEGNWKALQRLGVGSVEEMNKSALQCLQYGAEGLVIYVKNAAKLSQLLEGIDLRFIHIHLKCADFETVRIELDKFIQKKAWNAAELSIELSGSHPITIWENTLNINAAFLQNAGANAVTELGATLSLLVQALETEQQFPQIVNINVAVDTQHFEQIGKLMALRSLATFILNEYECKADLRITCTTSGTYLSAVDEANNLVRNSIAALSAMLAGCYALDIRPYNGDEQSAFAQRMALNQQFLLREEGYIAAVGNAPSGAYFIENYSEAIAEQAYAYFQEIQQLGGWSAAKAKVQTDVAAQAKAWIAEYAEGKRILLGVNKYAPKESVAALMPKHEAQYGFPQLNIERELREK